MSLSRVGYIFCLIAGDSVLSTELTNNFLTYSNSNGCEEIDGGGWTLVRHVAASEGTMHPATDRLTGTDIYGTIDYNAQSDASYSIEFDNIEFNQFLFAFGDCSQWLVTTKYNAIGDYYSKHDRCILASKDSPNDAYYAEWYNRDGVIEDPWISTKDHWDCRDEGGINDPCMLYGEKSYSGSANHQYGFTKHGGGNVWIRNKKDETRNCPYSNSNGCEEIDGGGWQLVRHVPASRGTMHPATDSLAGTHTYGTIDYNAQSDSTYSIKFDNIDFNQFLFSFGDCSEWLVTSKDAAIGELYSKEDRCILASNDSPNEVYFAEWYNRGSTVPEDPWISTKDHWDCRDDGAINDPCMVYGENNWSGNANHQYGFKTHGGGNVWIRNKNDEKRSCCDYSHICSVWGDPHITTFDGTTHHFQGSGYFDYLKTCDINNKGIELPITISAKHEECLDVYTCIREMVVEIKETNGDIMTILYEKDGTPLYKDGSSAIGEYSLDDGEMTVLVSKKNFEFSFPINDGSGNIANIRFSYSGWTLKLETSDCLSNYICGLCGTLNDQSNDDFTTCDQLQIIDNTGSAIVKPYDFLSDAWINTHNFGESCCRRDFDLLFLGESDCENSPEPPPEPDTDCMDESETICLNAWSLYCGSCDQSDASNEWISSCSMDICLNSDCKNSILENGLTVEMAESMGCLNTIKNECKINCPSETTTTTTNKPFDVCDIFYDSTQTLYELYLEDTENNVYNHYLSRISNPSYPLSLGYKLIGTEGFVWMNEIEDITFPLNVFYSAANRDYYYSLDSEPIDTSYTFVNIIGYIMNKECNQFNQPLYEYWSNSKKDHLYNINFDEIGNGNSDYEYIGIAGYVAKM